MIKIVIVDDEMLVRVGIKSLIDWEKHGFEIVGDASDGESAIKIIDTTLPDIVLTDIKMPNTDGLWLIERIKAKYPHMRIIVLSCYNDYQFVKTAMKLGADDYILKLSMKADDLLELLLDTRDKVIEQNKRRICEEQDSFDEGYLKYKNMFNLLLEKEMDCSTSSDIINIKYLRRWKILAVIKMHGFSMLKSYGKTAERLLFNFLEQRIARRNNGIISDYKENEFVILISFDEDINKVYNLSNRVFNDLIHSVKKYLNYSVSLGISPFFESLEEVRENYLRAKEALSCSFYSIDGGQYQYPADIPNKSEPLVFEKQMEDQLKLLIETGDQTQLNKYITQIINLIKTKQPEQEAVTQMFFDIIGCFVTVLKCYDIHINEVLSDELPVYQQILAFDFFNQAENWLYNFSECCCRLMEDKRKSICRKEVLLLIDYMKKNYFEDFNLKRASNFVHFSESYISRIFKEETGKNFIEYLAHIRIEKAKELLKTTDYLSYEIAQKVGYTNINYFGRVFKKITGISPIEFRKSENVINFVYEKY